MIRFCTLILIGLLCACSQHPFHDWIILELPDKTLSVEFPKQPIRSKESLTVNKNSSKVHHYILKHISGVYTLTVYPIPESILSEHSPRQILLSARNSGLLKSGGLILREQRISLQNNPGLWLQIESADRKHHVYTTFYVIDKRFVSLSLMIPATDKEPKEVNYFFNSLYFELEKPKKV